MELGAREEPVEEVDDGRGAGADEKCVGEGFELLLLEESGRPLFGVVFSSARG